MIFPWEVDYSEGTAKNYPAVDDEAESRNGIEYCEMPDFREKGCPGS